MQEGKPASLVSNIYGYVLQRRKPAVLQTVPQNLLEYKLDDLLEDVSFREWLYSSVQDSSVVVREADMLLIPALQALEAGWLRQSPDYLWALETYPELVDRIATLGLALVYDGAGQEKQG